MRSMKLLVATALVTALVAGPVLAQDATSGSTAPATTSTSTVKKHAKHHSGKKHHHSKKSSESTAPAPTTPAQ